MKKQAATDTNKEEYKCEHCGREFARPNTLLTHLCEQKRRWQDKDRPANRIAFSAWLKFYKQCQPSRKNKEYTDFMKSAYYIGFVKFGSYCADVGVVNPLMYVDWLLKENSPLDNWASDRLYTKYLVIHLRDEDVMDALKRSVETMLSLSEQENIQLCDFFRYVNSNKICQKIASGKISPWILYHSQSGIEFLGRLNDDQRSMIYEYIDPERWQIKFKRDQESVVQAVEVINGIVGL